VATVSDEPIGRSAALNHAIELLTREPVDTEDRQILTLEAQAWIALSEALRPLPEPQAERGSPWIPEFLREYRDLENQLAQLQTEIRKLAQELEDRARITGESEWRDVSYLLLSIPYLD
jgi:hypothetical protein